MRKRNGRLLAVASGAIIVATSGGRLPAAATGVLAQSDPAITAPDQRAEVESTVRAFLARRRIPGASIGVVHRGRVVHAAGYGTANLELQVPAGESTLFEIGSITKQFTAEAVMILVDAGRLRLDDPIRTHLAGLPDSWSGITVRHLLTHTSGIPDWEARVEFSYRREYTSAEFVALVAGLPLDFTPGERFAYTNSGFPLLGLIVEKVTGVSFEQFVRDRIFVPAGMRDTRFKQPPEIVPHRAGGYVERDGTLSNGEPLRPRVIAANGGILSSAADMARWHLALSGGTVVSPSAWELMTRPIQVKDGRPFNAGFAWFIDRFHGHRVLLHNGSTAGGFSSVVYRYPDDDLSVVVLMNIDRWNAVNILATNVANVFVSGLSTAALPERPDVDPQLSRRLLALLGDVANARDSDLLAANLRNPSGPPKTNRTFGFDGPVDRFAFLEREDFGAAGEERFGHVIRWIYRYRLAAGARVIYYTFEMTPQQTVARFFPEEQ